MQKATVAILAKDPTPDLLAAPNLSWIHVDHAGLNRDAKPEAFLEWLVITGSSGRSSSVLAEHALFFCLALAYRFPDFLDAQRAHQWGVLGQEDLRGLYGRTMGIVGLGNTGKELAIRAKGFGMKVPGYRRRTAAVPVGVDDVFSADAGQALDELLARSDFVVLALGLSDKTYRLIGERELQLIGPNGYLVNMARGPVVDEAALVRALHALTIAGAGLVTFELEPLPQDSPMWDAPNTLITPHVTPAVPDRTARSLEIIVDNIRRYAAGEPLLNQLTPEDMYTQT